MGSTKEYNKMLSKCRNAWYEAQENDLAQTDKAINHFCDNHTFEEGIAKLSKFINFEAETECAEWMGYCNNRGYGIYTIQLPTSPITSKVVKAHRLMFALYYGFDALPTGIDGKDMDGSLTVLDHICENTSCVNPLHLQTIAVADNARKAVVKRLRSA